MTPQELRNSILQLAIQGRLVEQRPEEGTGEELYQQIQWEKQAHIKAGKIRKEKPLPKITEEEIPFEIPEGWGWCRLSSVVLINPKNNVPDNVDAGFVPMPCVMDGYRNEHTFELKKWKEIKRGYTHFANDDIGFAKITPCFQNRKSVIFRSLPNGIGAGSTELVIIRVIRDLLCREYILWFLKSGYFISNGVKSFTGTAGQQRIHKDYLSKCVFPLPPLAEQKRIVAKIEELMPLIDRYEEAWTKLEEFNKRFPDDMQKSLLQLAIKGGLVPQDASEGTGEELYRQIQREKQALIKAGKIRKEKPLLEITEEEIPFEIPEGWKWVRLGDCSTYAQTKIKISPDAVTPDMWSLDLEDIEKESGRIIRYCKASERKISGDKVCFFRGQMLYSKLRPYLKKILVAPDDGICSSELVPFSMYGDIEPTYIAYVLRSPHIDFVINSATYGVKMPRVGTDTMTNLLIPLPPLAEQKRIVAKLEELLPLCDRLKQPNSARS